MFKGIQSLFSKDASRDGKPPEKRLHPGGAQVAMPLFSTTAAIEAAEIAKQWAALFPDEPPIAATGKPGGIYEFTIEGRWLAAVLIEHPAPIDELTHALRSSWMWQGESDEAIKNHRAHAIITAESTGAVLQEAKDVTRISACFLAAGSGVALYWGNSRQVHLPKLVFGFAASKAWPVPIWVGITISADSPSGPFTAVTHGLAALDHKEFEVRNTMMPIGELRKVLLDMSEYVLESGPVLEHGQTLGGTEAEKWPITHEPSQVVEGRAAIVIGIP